MRGWFERPPVKSRNKFQDTVEFTNGHVLTVGEATGDVNEETVRRIQIRETIKAHFEKEQQLFDQGIKVLSLFFIDQVAKYRDYSQPDERGDYARIFEEEYGQLKAEYLSELPLENLVYRKYLDELPVAQTHNGYFSIDKKTKHLKDPAVLRRGENAGLSDDVDAYDLILKDKERLLSFEEPIRFIFSHSALREGWDNPNVFVMCMLKHSDNTISRRQEVGRGLRLSVNMHGDRMDHPATVHDINVLTVVASESYKDFVANLQREISESLSDRPRVADKAYFTGKILKTEQGDVVVTEEQAAMIEFYLIQNGYVDIKRKITEKYHSDHKNDSLAALPEELKPYAPQVIGLINGVFSEAQLPGVDNGRKTKTNPLNDNFSKKAFKDLWNHINRKAVYQVEFESDELIGNSIRALDLELRRVAPLQYTIQTGQQIEKATADQLKSGKAFQVMETATEAGGSVHSLVQYDLLGKISENTQLTRKTLAAILTGIQKAVFNQFKQNPEHFITEASRIINEQKASIIIERLTYDALADRYDNSIFTAGQGKRDFTNASQKLKKHIYDYVITDSNVEREFVEELDTSKEVVVYAKLPRGFFIPTPVGDYNPDWAISFDEGKVKHIYFIAETKGTMSTLELRPVEQKKIECAQKFFEEINRKIDPEHVKYDVVDSYAKLMDIVGLEQKTA